MFDKTDHINRKHQIEAAKKRGLDSEDIAFVISRCPLKEVDKQILTMILIEDHDVGFVGWKTGYCDSRVKARFSAALEVFCAVATKMRLL